MAKLTLNELGSLSNQTSAVATINDNNSLIETALENTLSRNGLQPNAMGAALDMNGYDILNVGTITTTDNSTVDINVFNYIPFALQAAIQAKTSTTDVSTYIQQAIEVAASNGGGLVHIPAGKYYVKALRIKTGVTIRGDGPEATILFLPNSSNVNVLETDQFSSLLGGGHGEGPYRFAIRDLQIDGNQTNQTSSDTVNGLALYGFNYFLENLLIHDVAGHGIRASWVDQFSSTPKGRMESSYFNIKVDTCGRHGIWFQGPHDTNFIHVITVDSGNTADNTYNGFFMDGSGANGRFWNFHGWHRGEATNRVAYQFKDAGASGTQFQSCHFEGGRSQVYLGASLAALNNCMIYAHFGTSNTTMCRIESNDNLISNCYFGGDNVGSYTAVQIGTSAGTVRAGNIITGSVFNGFKVQSPFNFASDGGNFIIARGFCSSGGLGGFTGSLSGSTVIRYIQGGTVIEIGSNILPNVNSDLSTIGIPSQKVIVGNGSAITGAGTNSPKIQALGTDQNAAVQVGRWSADGSQARYTFLKSRNASLGSHTVVQSSDTLGSIDWSGSDGTAFINAASVKCVVDGTPGTNDMPGSLIFDTTADGAAATTSRLKIDNTGKVLALTPTAGLGYGTGAGGTITQITSRTTGVTLNTVCGSIQTDTTSLAAEASAQFTVTNSAVAITDTVVASIRSGSNGGNTDVTVSGVAAGSFNIRVSNNNAAAGTAETGAIIINFAVIKAVTA